MPAWMPRLMRSFARLSLPSAQRIGAWLGLAAAAFVPRYRRMLAANVAQAGHPPALARAAAREAGRMLGELPWLWLRPRSEALGARVRWDGAEHIEGAIAAGRGIVYLTPHLGSFEVCAQAVAERFGSRQPLTVMFRPSRQHWLRDVQKQGRERPGIETAPASVAGLRQMMRALKSGGAVGLLPDQVPPAGMGVWAPFFGRDAYTITLAARLAALPGVQRLTIWAERLPQGAGWTVHVQAPPADGRDASPATINAEMEALIRRAPAQYLWGYNRYKQPRDEGPAA